MAANTIGLSPELVIHPGETIAEMLEERGISQSELATCTDTSAAYVSNVIAGKKAISSRFAFALEYALGVPKSFWLNLQANYESELLELNEIKTITEEERVAGLNLDEVVSYLQEQGKLPKCGDQETSILALRKALRISNLANLKKCIPQNASHGKPVKKMNEYAVGAWVRICQEIGMSKTLDTPFQKEYLADLVRDIDELPKEAEDYTLFSRYGVGYAFVNRFSDTPVDGYIQKKSNGSYFIALTPVDTLQKERVLAIMKEIQHIVDGKLTKSSQFIDFSA